ncbi:MAG TPA: protein kinase [Gemmataceae bacterium]|jgi:serine/threonine protein kinase|nr:protein kinase [Gemmataceae bacterium]
MKCPDAVRLQDLLDEELEGEEYLQIEAHVEECMGCRATLEQMLAGGAEAESPPGTRHAEPSAAQEPAGEARVPESIGKYRVVERLGSGGQAEVFRAVHPTLGRDVVIKWARRRLPQALQQKLIDEGRVLARLDDPGVARVYDVDVCDGRPYVVLEYVAGRTLADVLRRDRLPFRATAAVMAKTAGILHRLHRGGLLHLRRVA